MNEVQERVLDELRRDGIAVTSFDELVGDGGLSARLQEEAAAFAREAEAHAPELFERDERRAHIVRRFRRSPLTATPGRHTFALDDPWLRFALSDRVIEVVNAYRGEATLLADLDCWYTIPSQAERDLSQQWRRAPWDEHVVKVFVYHSDVGEDAGPIEYVRGSPAGGRYGDLWPSQAGEHAVQPPEDELLARVAPDDFVAVTGPPGTAIVADAGGIHRGWWAQRPQVMSFATYISPDSTHARKYLSSSKPGFRFRVDWSSGGDLSPTARSAIGWSKRSE